MLGALPTVNAFFNALSACFLFLGWRAIRSGNSVLHRKMMIAAVTSSTIFLIGYLTRTSLTGHTYFQGSPGWHMVYLVILASHTLLAVVVLPLVLRTLFLAAKGRFAEHRRIVRFTLPIWSYVSVTGVVVYGMLYHWPK
jgi:uncharacterized membrane protein YozB (DUF420 family)